MTRGSMIRGTAGELRRAALLAAALAIAAPAAAAQAGQLDPAAFVSPRFGEVKVTGGVAFASAEDYKGKRINLYLDVYEPAGDASASRPAIVWIHGGGFRSDSSRTQGYIVRYATEFAKRGYLCVSIDYRLRSAADMPTDESEYPALVDATRDANTALAWLRKNAAAWRADPRYIFLAGGSAGGRIAMNLGIYDGEPGQAWDKAGLVAVCDLWGGPEEYMRMFPEVRGDDPPTVFVHGTADRTLDFSASEDMYERLRAAGVAVEMHAMEGADHTPTGANNDPLILGWISSFFSRELARAVASPRQAKPAAAWVIEAPIAEAAKAPAASAGQGGAAKAVPASTPGRIIVSADAHVLDGNGAGNNFGGLEYVGVKANAAAGTNRVAYLRFDLAEARRDFSSATLWLFCYDIDIAATKGLDVYGMDDESWIEGRGTGTAAADGSITWNARPAEARARLLGLAPASGPIVKGQWASADVTDFVRMKLAGSKLAGFMLKYSGEGKGQMRLVSRETTGTTTKADPSFADNLAYIELK